MSVRSRPIPCADLLGAPKETLTRSRRETASTDPDLDPHADGGSAKPYTVSHAAAHPHSIASNYPAVYLHSVSLSHPDRRWTGGLHRHLWPSDGSLVATKELDFSTLKQVTHQLTYNEGPP